MCQWNEKEPGSSLGSKITWTSHTAELQIQPLELRPHGMCLKQGWCGYNSVYPVSQRVHCWSHAGEPGPGSQRRLVALEPGLNGLSVTSSGTFWCVMSMQLPSLAISSNPLYISSSSWHHDLEINNCPPIPAWPSRKCSPLPLTTPSTHRTPTAKWRKAKGPTWGVAVWQAVKAKEKEENLICGYLHFLPSCRGWVKWLGTNVNHHKANSGMIPTQTSWVI